MKPSEKDYLFWLKNHLKESFKTPVLENFLGLNILKIEKGSAILEYTIKEMQNNFYGFAHGGVLASICDTAMGTACLTLDREVVTIDMNISYIKNVRSGKLSVKAEVINAGNTIIRTTAKIYHKDEILVRTQASYFITGSFYKKK